jgi:hypothetical protein
MSMGSQSPSERDAGQRSSPNRRHPWLPSVLIGGVALAGIACMCATIWLLVLVR